MGKPAVACWHSRPPF